MNKSSNDGSGIDERFVDVMFHDQKIIAQRMNNLFEIIKVAFVTEISNTFQVKRENDEICIFSAKVGCGLFNIKYSILKGNISIAELLKPSCCFMMNRVFVNESENECDNLSIPILNLKCDENNKWCEIA